MKLLQPNMVLPPEYQDFFPFDRFNLIQSLLFPHLYQSDQNVVISAPLGSGKTVLAELAILRCLDQNKKIFYVVPTKALASEKYQDFHPRYKKLGYITAILTGDIEFLDNHEPLHAIIASSHIIFITIEKFDALLRNTNNWHLLYQFGCVIIDEIHYLGDPQRGGILEATLTRLKLILEKFPELYLRIIGLSGTLPNAQEIGNWLNARVFEFKGAEFEQTNIHWKIVPYKANSYYQALNQKNRILERIFKKFNYETREFHPFLVFVGTRKETIEVAQRLANFFSSFPSFQRLNKEFLRQLSQKVENPELSATIQSGVAFHHAGLSKKDRTLVENAFRTKKLVAIIATTTLASGINIPAKVVVVRDFYPSKEISQLHRDILTINQMIGRTARSKYYKKGYAYVFVEDTIAYAINQLLETPPKIQSQILKFLMDYLNVEIQCGIISDVNSLEHWIKNLFLYFTPAGKTLVDESEFLTIVWNDYILKLKELDLIQFTNDGSVYGTFLGNAIAKFYLRIKTGVILAKSLQAQKTWNLLEFIWTLSAAAELENIKVKKSELPPINAFLSKFNSTWTNLEPKKKKRSHSSACSFYTEHPSCYLLLTDKPFLIPYKEFSTLHFLFQKESKNFIGILPSTSSPFN